MLVVQQCSPEKWQPAKWRLFEGAESRHGRTRRFGEAPDALVTVRFGMLMSRSDEEVRSTLLKLH